MQIQLDGNPDFGRASLVLGSHEVVRTESGAMSFADPGLDLRVVVPGGLLGGLARRLLGGESFFLGEYQGPRGGRLGIAPSLPGEVIHRTLRGETLRLTAGSFLACSEGIATRTRFGGLRSLFSGEGAFLIEVSGEGELLFNAYGAIVERELDGELIVDTGHLVAFEESIEYEISGFGGLKSTLFSGEGLTMRMRGRGRVWLQTRTVRGTAGWVTPYLRG
ncbi:TIGR00266 family protein [Engelhardtia mirabilis]|uniref:TIGR00266 family protein n=1 Tax=Engelhardtia mirabilis TaxID=2528011 RepID=A0A518BHK0_9BACT|nr:hypothetical protein Pla133_14850 [Planctomycetes bacterium Pla133]QDV00739.1 hypothetical protein Pla86_14840 [Planctomycetes bacterium Pla86]